MSKSTEPGTSDFNRMVQDHKDRVFNTCYGFVKNRADADDLAQEVFVEVYLSYAKFKGESSISTWVYRIAVNKSLDFIRKKNTAKRWGALFQVSSDDDEQIDNQAVSNFTPETALEQKEREGMLQQAIDRLPEKQKTAFVLHKYEELSYKEIGEIMNKKLPAIESLLHRAKLNLRKWLERYYQEEKRA